MKPPTLKKEVWKTFRKFNKEYNIKLLSGWDCIAAFCIAFVIDVAPHVRIAFGCILHVRREDGEGAGGLGLTRGSIGRVQNAS